MKLRIENNEGIKITVESPRDSHFCDVSKITEMMRDIMTHLILSDIPKDTDKSNTCLTPEDIELIPTAVKQEDRMVIRPRIPNNIVDINDLTIEKAVTENALVRCPNCGQAHCLSVPSNNHIYLMRRDFKNNEFGIVAEFDSLHCQSFIDVCCKPDTNRKAYYDDLQTLDFEYDADFTVDNDTEIFCPVCCNSSEFSTWKDAFENPLVYFETEHLCDACGGEKLEKLVKKNKVYQCDKCGLVTDFKEE